MHAVTPASAPALSIQAQNHLGHRVASPGVEEEAEPERASSEQTECRQEQPTQREGRMASRSLGTEGSRGADKTHWPWREPPGRGQNFTTRDMEGWAGWRGQDACGRDTGWPHGPHGSLAWPPWGRKEHFYFLILLFMVLRWNPGVLYQ